MRWAALILGLALFTFVVALFMQPDSTGPVGPEFELQPAGDEASGLETSQVEPPRSAGSDGALRAEAPSEPPRTTAVYVIRDPHGAPAAGIGLPAGVAAMP